MSINRVVITGNLTRDSELRSTSTSISVLRFGVAVNDRRYNSQEQTWEEYANYFDCTMFGVRAEKLKQYLSRGTRVAIEGKLRWSQWEKDGQKRSKVEIIVDDVVFLSQRSADDQQPNVHQSYAVREDPARPLVPHRDETPQFSSGQSQSAGAFEANRPSCQATAAMSGESAASPSSASAPMSYGGGTEVYDEDIPF